MFITYQGKEQGFAHSAGLLRLRRHAARLAGFGIAALAFAYPPLKNTLKSLKDVRIPRNCQAPE
jgi:hypothetical protein